MRFAFPESPRGLCILTSDWRTSFTDRCARCNQNKIESVSSFDINSTYSSCKIVAMGFSFWSASVE